MLSVLNPTKKDGEAHDVPIDFILLLKTSPQRIFTIKSITLSTIWSAVNSVSTICSAQKKVSGQVSAAFYQIYLSEAFSWLQFLTVT